MCILLKSYCTFCSELVDKTRSAVTGDMSSISAYFATLWRLTPSLRAISTRGMPPASIDRMSFIMSRGTPLVLFPLGS